MKIVVLLLCLILPLPAFAQHTYDVSCQNVSRIRVIRVQDTNWCFKTATGVFHSLWLDIKSDYQKEYRAAHKSAPHVSMTCDDEQFLKEDFVITAHGTPLQNDIPEMAGYATEGFGLIIIDEQDAFDAARAVCPALVPDKVLIDGHLDEE